MARNTRVLEELARDARAKLVEVEHLRQGVLHPLSRLAWDV